MNDMSKMRQVGLNQPWRLSAACSGWIESLGMRGKGGNRGGERGGPLEGTTLATHTKTIQRPPEGTHQYACAKFISIRPRKRAPGWAERAFTMLENGSKKKIEKKSELII